MSEPVVEVKSITKLFKAFKAVDSVSFEVYTSEIVGIVGPNGAGFDPDIADKVRKYLLQIKQEKKIPILLTSHNMKEMEEVSDRIIFLHKGKVIASGKPEAVVQSFRGKNLEDVFLCL